MQKPPTPGSQEPVTWKKFHGEMVNKMRIEKLKEAMKRREREQLESAVKDARAAQVPPDHEVLLEAEQELELLCVKEDLKLAIDNKDANSIREQMDKITKNKFYHTRLQSNLAEARRELDRLERMYRLSSYILDMDRKTMGEMRRYNNPPQAVKDVIQAIMLLFKQDQEVTQKWSVCLQFMYPDGPKGMNRRILDFNIKDVHPEIGAKVLEVLDKYELSQLQAVSAGVATFYVWARGVLEEMGSSLKVKPADIKRQKELLAPPPVISPRRRRKQGSGEEWPTSPRK